MYIINCECDIGCFHFLYHGSLICILSIYNSTYIDKIFDDTKVTQLNTYVYMRINLLILLPEGHIV